MLLAIASVFLFKRYGTQAVPLRAPTLTSSAFEAPVFIRNDSSPGCNNRTVLDILWSCLATTFACTWVSVHPNVPFKGEGRWALLRRRLYLMCFSIFAPEFMIMWAFKQWRGAVVIREAVNKAIRDASPDKDKPIRKLWTTTHGHLLQMGGFRLRATARETFYWAGTTALGSRSDRPPSVGDDNPLSAYISTVQKQFGALSSLSGDDLCNTSVSLRSALFNAQLFYRAEESRVSVNTHPCQQTTSLRDSDDILEGVLTFRTLKKLLSENLVRFPTITEDEIDDKSKGDALSKGIALLQLAWFIVQIISRATQGLVISELELTTAALAGLNSVMYVFWWNKPHDVRFPVVIRTKCVDEILTKRSEDAPWTFPDSGSASEFDIRKYLLTTMTTSIKRLLNALVRFFLSLPEALRDASVGLYKSALAFSHGLVILCSRIRQFVRTIGSAICNESAESTGIREEASKVGPKHTFEVHDALELDEKKDVKPEIGDGVKSNKKRPNHTPYGIMGTAKIAMKLIALPFYLLLYTIDLTLYIPIAKIISANDDNALSKDMTSGFDVENISKIYSMIFYSENAGAKPLLATSSIAGALFGLVHCLAWDFSFPSLVEKILWRSASLGVVGSCAAIFYAVLAYQIDDDENDGDDGVKKKGNVVFGILLVVATALCSLASFVYPVSRVALIILAVASLRSLPPSAFDTVDWIELVPHESHLSPVHRSIL